MSVSCGENIGISLGALGMMYKTVVAGLNVERNSLLQRSWDCRGMHPTLKAAVFSKAMNLSDIFIDWLARWHAR